MESRIILFVSSFLVTCLLLGGCASTTEALLGQGEGAGNIATTVYEALLATRFSRTDETEADRIGLELAARAGYDPRAGISLWQKMLQAGQGGGRPPEFLSTHPAEASRIEQIQSLLPTVTPLYQQAGR